MEEQLKKYLINTLPQDEEWVLEIEQQAKNENIPIMDRLSMNFLMQLIRIYKPRRILEIGTAIGYSALRMLEACPSTTILSIEQDNYRYEQAIKHIQLQNKQEDIKVIHGDALEELVQLPRDEAFDFIFIDAAKGQYKRFFELAHPLLNNNGIILSDNVLFKGYIVDSKKAPPKFEKIADKVKEYNQWLIQLSHYNTTIVPIGDGIAISYKVSDERSTHHHG